jgi:NAD(P)H-hydrate epimerase
VLLLSAQQIQQWDAFTMQQEPIASIDLMERAAQRCVDWIAEQEFINRPVKIFCGKGNNGGDGLAIARMLLEKGRNITVYILEFGARGTDDFQINLHLLHQVTTNIYFISATEFIPNIDKDDVVIDALYGSGLNRPLQLLGAEIVKQINQSKATVISIDVPSGMSIDKSSKANTIVYANHTLTFQSLKLCFLMAENADYFGEVHVLDIELHPLFLERIYAVFEMISKEKVVSNIKIRKSFSHKGVYGHALLVAGNKGKIGAALLAGKGCLRTGAGLLTINIPQEDQDTLYSFLPEAMAMKREEEIVFDNFSSIGIGPGLGTDSLAQKLLLSILQQYKKPMVLDADALNIIAENKDWLQLIPEGSILTPHPKEFDRLIGACDNDFDRLNKAVALSMQHSFNIVLKGHHTLIAAGGKGRFNDTGNAGLAKGGSGDVLTGMITSLLAQSYEPLQAALIGVYLHGLAGDLALENQSAESLLATDVIDAIGKAFNFLRD